MGWFSLSAVDPKKSEALQQRLDDLTLVGTLVQAKSHRVDEAIIKACESGELSRSVLVQRLLDLAAGYQRVSNPNAVWARIIQVEPCITPLLPPGSELRLGTKVLSHSTAAAHPPARCSELSDNLQSSVPPLVRHSNDARRDRHYYRPPRRLAKNEGLSAAVYPYHVPDCKHSTAIARKTQYAQHPC